MRSSNPPRDSVFTTRRFTLAWAIGTGLPVALPPGDYRISGEEVRDGRRYLCLEGAYRLTAGVREQGAENAENAENMEAGDASAA